RASVGRAWSAAPQQALRPRLFPWCLTSAQGAGQFRGWCGAGLVPLLRRVALHPPVFGGNTREDGGLMHSIGSRCGSKKIIPGLPIWVSVTTAGVAGGGNADVVVRRAPHAWIFKDPVFGGLPERFAASAATRNCARTTSASCTRRL